MLGKREPEQSRSIVMAVGIALFALALPALAHSTQRLQVTEQRNAAEGFAVTLWMTQVDVLGKHCSTLGSKSDHRFREVLASWQKRNSPYVNAALEYMADIEDSIKASQGEAARQDFRNQRKAEFVESTHNSEAVWFPDGKVDEQSCQHMTSFVADGSLDVDKNKEFFPILQEMRSVMPEVDDQE